MRNVLSDKNLVDIFPEISDSSEIYELFKDVKILNINVYKKSRKVEVFISSDKLIQADHINSLKQKFINIFKLDMVEIKPRFNIGMPFINILPDYFSSIISIVNRQKPISKGLLHECKWEMTEHCLEIRLSIKGSEVLHAQGCDSLTEKIIEESFGEKVRVQFIDSELDGEEIDKYNETREKEEAEVINIAMNAPNSAQGSKWQKQKEQQDDTVVGVILGKKFNDPVMKISEVTPDSGKVVVRGSIFRVESREIRGGKFLFMFDMTDYSSSVTIKFFFEKNDLDFITENVVDGIDVKVRGETQYDKFSKELTVIAADILEMNKVLKTDNAEVKRVELHLHTQMSSMDAVTSAKELVERAAQWGHKAIAITDHGVVQAYPEAFNAGKKNNIKIIYGIECYLLDDSPPVVYKSNGQSIQGEFVVFDLETTGLNPYKDKITEIGAVKIRDGKIIDKFNSFVNPGMPIPSMIVKMTGITNEMVEDAPTIEPVLLQFLEFINGAVLVAHNAPFDISFITHNAKLIGEHINNSYIDTLQLSRKMFPDLGKYKLAIVAKHLSIDLKDAHRALNDTTATAEIFVKCLEILKGKGVNTIDDIENAFDGIGDFTKNNSYHAVILVKNMTGLRNLYKIVSESHLKYYYKRPRVPKKLLMKYREGLILGSACEAGELYRAILDKRSDEELSKIVRFYDYLEIQPLGNNQFLINNGKVHSREELKNINRKIIRYGEKFKKPVVATCDVHFMDSRDEVYRRILMAGQGFTDADNQALLYFRTTEEMLDEFAYLGSEKAYEVVVTNTNSISDLIEDVIPIPDGTFPPNIDGAEEEIRSLAENKAKEIYGDHLPPIVDERLVKELNSIIKNGFSVMYIIAQKLVKKSLDDGYLVGSRGSVGSSFVANMTGITEVNSLPPHYICTGCKHSEFIIDGSIGCGFDLPDKYCPNCGKEMKKDGYDIPFETFLGFDGDKEPDIDLNFSGEYQSKAHKYTEVLFGEGKVFRAGTISTVAEKTAYGFVKGYLDERNIVVTNAEINRLVKGCTGIKRTTGQHPGGVMIVPRDREIYEFCPIQRPADDTDSNTITTHFDYHSISGRLLKLDILGHDDPTVIRMLEDLTGIDARTITIGEKKTMALFSSTESLGIKPEDINSEVGTFAIPEFGTKFVRQMLVDTKPTTFSELIRISGLSHGTDVWLNNAQELVRAGTATLSEVICTRDDIMLYLLQAKLPPKTAFKIMEDVRKGKGLKPEYIDLMKECKVPEWYIQSCQKIKYMFPKAHAAAYVMMAFRIAWFKVYHPEAFYATYFTVRADDFDAEIMTHGQDKVRNKIKEFEQKGNQATQKEKNILTILEVANEMYARGIKFLPVDLYESDTVKFKITPKGIRPPLNALQGLGAAAAQSIVEARGNEQFLSIDELRIKAKISKSVIEILQKHGCLAGVPESNQMSLF
ncbi:MAG TPA: PolC-type DNA polymerase III [Clostridia bacterium]|nr:PolC-type DNA polymerase III [Clostridia bacterium]